MSRYILSGIAAIVACTITASATVTVPAEFREIVADSALILRGHVTDVRGVVSRDRGIESIATIAVDGMLKGRATDFVSVNLPGGVVGRIRSRMVGVPTLRAGAQAVFFLKRDRNNAWRPVGLSMGIYPVQAAPLSGAPVITPPVVIGQTADAGTTVRGDSRRRLMPVAEFESLVRLVMAGQAGPPARGTR